MDFLVDFLVSCCSRVFARSLLFLSLLASVVLFTACGSGSTSTDAGSTDGSNGSSGTPSGDSGGQLGGSGGGSGPIGGTPTATIVLNAAGQTYTAAQDLVADGTAFSVAANDVTIDLNGHTVTYNAASNASSVYGIYVAQGVSGLTIENGTILQGAGNSASSPAIHFIGSSWARGHSIHDLVIRVTGWKSDGIEADSGYSFDDSEIYRVYIEDHGDTDAIDGAGADPIIVDAMNLGHVRIHDNILVAGHKGVNVRRICEQCSYPVPLANQSEIYNNKIQHRRRAGSKAPYGIQLAGRTHGVYVHDNQIASDDGRGIILDGWGQGVSEGCSGNTVSNNRIDVTYSSVATSGAYVENNVYGIRDRYSSGDNTITGNTILVASEIAGDVFGMYIGSDATDLLMSNIVVDNNTVIARKGAYVGNTPYVYWLDYINSISISNTKYLTEGSYSNSLSRVTSITQSSNTALSLTPSSPAAPTGLHLTRFLDSYVLEWNANAESDVFEYNVYRDGTKIPMTPRGVLFYVDVGIGGSHDYQISAVTESGTESALSTAVATTSAANGWW